MKKISLKIHKKRAFSLPEVIVAFSVLVLVIVSASNVLAVVMRTNADNVNSMVAYGLAQEGIENMRFIRDSNFVLGLDFDGSIKSSPSSVWGEKLFDKLGSSSNFILINKNEVFKGCTKINLKDCLPVALELLENNSVDKLIKSDATLVYRFGGSVSDSDLALSVPATGEGFYFIQSKNGLPANAVPTQFHRLIHVQPFKVNSAGGAISAYDGLRVTSLVSWVAGGIQKKVVLTTELTDWK